MRHVPDGTLRRLLDEPLAVADSDARHLVACSRCRSRRDRVAADAAAAARLLGPHPFDPADPAGRAGRAGRVRRAWERQEARPGATTGGERTPAVAGRGGEIRSEPPWRWRFMGTSLGSGITVAAAGVVVAGVAAAATLTTVFAPTTVAPVPISHLDLKPLAGVLGLSDLGSLRGIDRPSGSTTFSLGTVSWSSSGQAETVSSLSAAEAATGLSVSLPSTLPNGVGAPVSYVVQPKITGTVTLGARAGSLSGSTLEVTLGPGIAVAYGGTAGGVGAGAGGAGGPGGTIGSATGGINPLGILAMERPLVTSNGATTAQLEDFLLSQPGIPPQLADELRLVGNLQTTLPVPTPAGADTETVQIGGSPGILVSDGSGAAAGAIWEDQNGIVHAVAGLLDQQDVLSVARQIG